MSVLAPADLELEQLRLQLVSGAYKHWNDVIRDPAMAKSAGAAANDVGELWAVLALPQA